MVANCSLHPVRTVAGEMEDACQPGNGVWIKKLNESMLKQSLKIIDIVERLLKWNTMKLCIMIKIIVQTLSNPAVVLTSIDNWHWHVRYGDTHRDTLSNNKVCDISNTIHLYGVCMSYIPAAQAKRRLQ